MTEPRTTQSEIHETIGAMGQLEKTLHRLIIEDFTSLLAKYQLWTLDQFDRQNATHMEVLAGISELKKDWLQLGDRLQEQEARQAELIEYTRATRERVTNLQNRIDEEIHWAEIEHNWLERHDKVLEELQTRIPDYDSLRHIVAHLAGYLDLADDAMISIDGQHRITWVNGAAETMFGYQSIELLGSPIGMLIPDRYQEAHEHHIEAFAASGVTSRRMAERQLIFGLHKNGTEFPIRAAISRMAGGAELYAVVLRKPERRKARSDE